MELSINNVEVLTMKTKPGTQKEDCDDESYFEINLMEQPNSTKLTGETCQHYKLGIPNRL